MSVSAQAGLVSFGPQAEKGTLADTWYRHRATMVDLGVADDVREGVPEVGGIPVPTFPYKAGPIIAGGLTIQPRLEDTIGWLLYGLLGNIDSENETGVGSGIFDHVFNLSPDDPTYVPWMSFRKMVPKKDGDADTDLGEIYKDCKIIGGSLVLPNDSPINLRLDVLGREFLEDDAPDAWDYDNTIEHWESIPVACRTEGFIKIGGVELPVVACTVSWQNVPLDIRQEKVFGNPFLEDITIISRRLSYDIVVKWNNSELYRQVLTGDVAGTEWGSQPFTAAFSVRCVSSKVMPGETEPYYLQVDASEVLMSQVGGITLAGNQAVMLRFQGVALEADEYATFTLHNKKDTYVWPVSGS